MMKKFLIVLVIALACTSTFSSCNKPQSTNTNEPQSTTTNEKVPSQAELEQKYAQAEEYENNGKFKSAIEIYRELHSYGFTDPEFGSYGLDEALRIREKRYAHQKIISQYYSDAVRALKKQLKDPNSLVVYSMKVSHNSPQGKITIIFDYGAKNSFGGMVRDEYSQTFYLAEYEKNEVYELSKDHMNRLGLTAEDAGQYLAGNHHIYEESQFSAIVNGTND